MHQAHPDTTAPEGVRAEASWTSVSDEILWTPDKPNANDSSLLRRGLPRVDGKFLAVGAERFWINGVTYGTFHPNDQGEPYPPLSKLRDDFAMMAEAGVNTVRLYTPPTDRIADAAADAGLFLMPDLCWGPRTCGLHDPEDLKAIYEWTRGHARRLADHPAMLMFSIGNEIPPLIVRWYGRHKIERFLRNLHDTVKTEAPDRLVTYVCHPPTEYLHLPFLDVVSFNVYLEREPEFRRYMARLQAIAGDRPLMLTEVGLDSASNGEVAQARLLDWQLRAAQEKGLCGSVVFGWTDEWSVFEAPVEGWAFGLTDAARRPKPALEAVSKVFQTSRYELREKPWPRVTVVVACYNGAATLEECLRSLVDLNYPNYEVIVINDGSSDETPEIAVQFPFRTIHVENGGLSRARNLGIEESTGEIVAFLDSDAYADPDWLYFLVESLEEQNADAVGGPNIVPLTDGFVAQCVDRSPGNPTHVLIDDELAEHVPGCNMAYRKEALLEIGGFDVQHRVAGDDVDVCWKLLARDRRIAFSPGGFVWHHRRATVRSFLKQQRGYGYAESHLKRHYPGRFNVFGHMVWPGRIYDGFHDGMRLTGLPSLLPSRVYQGRFGSSPFQSLYQPIPTWWFQAFMTAEWQLTTLCVIAAGGLTLPFLTPAGVGLLLFGMCMALMSLAGAATAGWYACQEKTWRGREAYLGGGLVALLHLLQPLARAWGQILGWWASRGVTVEWPDEQSIWCSIDQRDPWLNRLSDHLNKCGWSCREACDWGNHDLEVTGPGPQRVYLDSVAEERLNKGWFQVRFRIISRPKAWGVALTVCLLAVLPVFVILPSLLPLALPVLAGLRTLLKSKRRMVEAVSQLAMECAEGMGFPNARGYRC